MSRRKAYRPKPVNRPILRETRDKLMMPAYTGLELLRTSADQQARESALLALNVLLCYCREAAEDRWGDDAFTDDLHAGLAALATAKDRHERTGQWGVSGPELSALRRAVEWCDCALSMLGTASVTTALARMYVINEASQ